MQRADFVIVGAGIAGSALAHALASGGRQVLVLEHDLEYRDKVRGENMTPWGVAEVKAQKRQTTEIVAQTMQMLGRAGEGGAPTGGGGGDFQSQDFGSPEPAAQGAATDDDLPF